jgi:hypothetical protein
VNTSISQFDRAQRKEALDGEPTAARHQEWRGLAAAVKHIPDGSSIHESKRRMEMRSKRISSNTDFMPILAHRARRNFPLAVTAFVSTLVLLGIAWTPASAMPKATPTPTASVTAVQLPNSVAPAVCAVAGEDLASPGLYGDGQHLAADGSSVYGFNGGLIDGSRGGFILEPPCPTKSVPIGRAMTLVLTDAASAELAPPNASLPICGRIWLVVPGVPGPLATAQVNDIIGLAALPGTSTGNSVFVYFAPGTSPYVYNLIWQAGIRVTSRTDTGNQTTLGLSTRGDSSKGWSDLSGDAELINHSTSTGLGHYCVPLDLTVVVTQ